MPLALKRPRSRVLSGPVEIDWTHPLAEGLAFLFLPGRSPVLDLVRNQPLALGAGQYATNTGEGPGLLTVNGSPGIRNNISSRGIGQYSMFAADRGFNIQNPHTIAARVVPHTFANSENNVFSLVGSAGHAGLRIYGNSTPPGFWAAHIDNNVSFTDLSCGTSIQASVPVSVAQSSYSNYQHQLFVDGVYAPTTGDNTNISIGTQTFTGLSIGGYYDSVNGSMPVMGQTTLECAFWNRGLGTDEHAEWAHNPYAMVRPAIRRRYYFGASSSFRRPFLIFA